MDRSNTSDPVRAAAVAQEAVRRLVHATRQVPPVDAYPVLAHLDGLLHGLRQVLVQLADTHDNDRHVASVGGDRTVGREVAGRVARQLRVAADTIDNADLVLNHAWTGTGRLTWTPTPTPPTRPPTRPIQRGELGR